MAMRKARILPSHREWLLERLDPIYVDGWLSFKPNAIVTITREPHEGFYEAWDNGSSIIVPKRFIEFLDDTTETEVDRGV